MVFDMFIDISVTGIIFITIYALSFVIPIIMGLYLTINFIRAPYRKPQDFKYSDPANKFAILIPACNESRVISKTIAIMKTLDYPVDMFNVIVIADNCTDNTADLALEAGAIVFRRDVPDLRSKAYALDWFFNKGYLEEAGYDAFCLVDADTILDSNFLREIDREMTVGYPVVYGRIGSLNPYASMTSNFMTVLTSFQNRLWNLPQSILNRSGFFAGTGVSIKVSFLKEIGWDIHTLVEDAEFSIQTALQGGFCKYCDNARFYVEQVNTLSGMWRQQRRWRTGHIGCLQRYGGRLIHSVFIKRNVNAIAPLLLVMIPVTCISSVLQIFVFPIVSISVLGNEFISPLGFIIAFAIQFVLNFILQSIVLLLDGRFSWKLWKGISAMMFAPIFYGITDITCLLFPMKEWRLMIHGDAQYLAHKD